MEKLWEAESESLILCREEVDLREICRTVCRNFESESHKKDIDLTCGGDASILLADKNRLSQVVTNLLSNAIKYSPNGTAVSVTVENGAGYGKIIVEDRGVGIPKDELPLIFERFYRVDKSRSRRTGGIGLGLTIAKSIMEAHGGQIEALSEKGEGSRFVATLFKK
jgi:signal transduction histidine kinase